MMKRSEANKGPKTLDDLSHLYFSNRKSSQNEKSTNIPSPSPPSSSGQPEIEKQRIKNAIADRMHVFHEGATLVENEPGEPAGIDLLCTDPSGRPVFVDISLEKPEEIPLRIFRYRHELVRRGRLYRKAYESAGMTDLEHPVFIFILRSCPSGLKEAVPSIDGVHLAILQVQSIWTEDNRMTVIRELINNYQPHASRALRIGD